MVRYKLRADWLLWALACVIVIGIALIVIGVGLIVIVVGLIVIGVGLIVTAPGLINFYRHWPICYRC